MLEQDLKSTLPLAQKIIQSIGNQIVLCGRDLTVDEVKAIYYHIAKRAEKMVKD